VGFADISSRTAILQAIEEWDSMGRPVFLAEYGFSEARRYFEPRTVALRERDGRPRDVRRWAANSRLPVHLLTEVVRY
jgi:hypothetical protein